MIIVILIFFSLTLWWKETNIFMDDHACHLTDLRSRDSSRKRPLGLFQWRYGDRLVAAIFLIHRFHRLSRLRKMPFKRTDQTPLSKRSLEIPSPTREISDCKITLERQWDRFNSQDGGDWSIVRVFERIVEVAEKTRSKQYIYIYTRTTPFLIFVLHIPVKNNVKLIIIIFFSNRNTNFELIYYYSFKYKYFCSKHLSINVTFLLLNDN